MTAVASALTDAQVAVYPVDARGMETQALFDPESRGKTNPFFGRSYVEPREQRSLLESGIHE